MTRRLRGMTWDHARGYDPLAKGVPLFSVDHPDYEIEWTRRSLRDFGVQPVEALAEQFDIIVIDHPFCGRAKATGCLLDLRPLFPAEFFAMLDRESVGASTRSYHYAGGIWALPTDAAAQVASYRPDLLAALGWSGPPRTFAEVLALGEAARKAGKWLGLPGVPSDAACLIASFGANLGTLISPDADRLLAPDAFDAALGYLDALRPFCHPRSADRNPIATYDAMSTGDDIVYTPFGFGYTNYARAGVKNPIRYTSVAGPGADPQAGAILGGAGCAISAQCRDVEAAVVYLAWLHTPEHQAGPYFRNGGQPGLRSAWTLPEDDREAGGFFSGTLPTLDKAYVRPRFDGFIPAFEHMGELVHLYLGGQGDRGEIIRSSNEAYGRARAAAKA